MSVEHAEGLERTPLYVAEYMRSDIVGGAIVVRVCSCNNRKKGIDRQMIQVVRLRLQFR